MEYVAIASLVAGTALKAAGAAADARARSDSLNADATAHDYNADRLREQAEIVQQQAGVREDAVSRKGRAVMGMQRATLAGSGLDSSTGSLALVQEQSADNAGLDALMIRYQGNLEARGINAQATLEQYQGRVSRANAQAARRGGYIGVATSLLQGASKGYSGGMSLGGTVDGGPT